EIQDARAQGILLEHPNLGIADWAYQQTISSNGIQLLKSSPGNLKQISRLTEQLMETVKNYQCYKTKRHNSTEPFEGYYGLGWLQGLDFLIHAVDALAPSSRAAQSSLLKRISELFPNSRRVSNYIDKLNSFEEPFELSFTDLASGKCIDTNDYRGYVLIVDFWATWCQPCLTFVPYLKRLLSRHSNEVQVIGISNDDAGLSSDATPEQRLKLEAEVIKCATKHGMDWPILLDSKVHEKWCISSIPTLFVVDQRGILRSLDARRTIAKTVRNLLREKS
ncbi:MAG: TlpA disulfide reductase family protein, partial [Gammaproteobacteria bacterium]|nr:TlpA disulfide reductase family protein [Gammaproteobacteria bacterium]